MQAFLMLSLNMKINMPYSPINSMMDTLTCISGKLRSVCTLLGCLTLTYSHR